MLPQEQVQWLIPQIQELQKIKIDATKKLEEFENILKNSEPYKIIEWLKEIIKKAEQWEEWLREQGKQIMLDNGLKKFEMLDGTTIQLNSTPGALVVAEWVQLDPKYYKEKTTVTMDKVQVKKDFMEGLILDPGVTIESDYKFIIKSK